MIEIYALKAEYSPDLYEFAEKFQVCFPRINPIGRNSLFTKILSDYCGGFGAAYKNLSHSGEWCVCCLGEYPCGIDLEKKRHIPPKLIPEGFSPDSALFLKQWTKLESYVKYTGKGLPAFPSFAEGGFVGVKFWEHSGIDGYELCVCAAENAAVSKEVKVLTINKINQCEETKLCQMNT